MQAYRASNLQQCKHRGIRPLRQVYVPLRSVLNVCHWHTAPPNGHASMSTWLVARRNKTAPLISTQAVAGQLICRYLRKETDQSGSLFSPFNISQKAKSRIPEIIFPAAEGQTQPSLLKMSFHLYPDTRSNDCTVPEFPVFPLVVLLSCPLL